MDEEMAIEMASIYEKIRNVANQIDNAPISDKAKQYVQLLRYSIELEKQKEKAYLELNENEKEEAQSILKEILAPELPKYLPVSEVSMMLNVSPQMVRRYCAEGKILGKRRHQDSGKWLIPTEQFLTKPEFVEYIQKKEVNRIKSIKAAQLMLQMIDEDEEDDEGFSQIWD
ncbi:DNA-binding protein [Bacillus canaveralius]|uniref:DNA-binding protein n=1 Tax=Bacillus canaveralius TaxID=1403243 RepID=A0A2N5GFT9_9BACI|nr:MULTISPECIES: helix-turn-helix domain-containing protein [Bacillus]PLR79570.1 DNA-binding protein [Bacillus canaveralius]PLR86927.1 DNA-binding protein [Bacillus sp. V33-4]PLR91681.1 DNA-binding protein [Bacillus canaveralius]RSK53276.1 DNA-binding protein [Bacillus canaveralius]